MEVRGIFNILGKLYRVLPVGVYDCFEMLLFSRTSELGLSRLGLNKDFNKGDLFGQLHWVER
jgi:hypothetical protein